MLEVENLLLFYENVAAVNDVTLKCGDNQIVGVFGINSSGKSSLLHAVSGLIIDMKEKEEMRGGIKITMLGKIKFDGQDIVHLQPYERARKGIVLCPERRRIFAESSVLENLKIGGYLASSSQAQEMLEYVLTIFPTLAQKDIQKRQGGFLSGGEQQMLAIGRALMAQPKLLLLDEPLLGLSPAIIYSLAKTIKQLKEQRGLSILVTEQHPVPLLPIVDYAYIMENGSLALEGTGEELLANPDVKSAYFGV